MSCKREAVVADESLQTGSTCKPIEKSAELKETSLKKT